MAEHLYVFLKIFFRAAIDDEVIRKYPLKGVVHPKSARVEMRILTSNELGRMKSLLDADSSDSLAIFTTFLRTGIRRSELAGLRWVDVDFDRSTLQIRRSYHVVNGHGLYKPTKTLRSTRTIKLGIESLRQLSLQRTKMINLAELAGRPISISAPVFTPDGIKPYSPDSLTHRWANVRKKLGLEDVRLHDFRHTYATLLISSGISVGTVADLLGHASPKTTLDTYWHTVPSEQEAAADRLDEILGSAIQ